MHKSHRNQQPHQGWGNNNHTVSGMIILRVHIVILKYVGHLKPGMRTDRRKPFYFLPIALFEFVSFDAALGSVYVSVKRTNLNGASTMDEPRSRGRTAVRCEVLGQGPGLSPGLNTILNPCQGRRDRQSECRAIAALLAGSWNCCFTLRQMPFELQQLHWQQIEADTKWQRVLKSKLATF